MESKIFTLNAVNHASSRLICVQQMASLVLFDVEELFTFFATERVCVCFVFAWQA